MRPNFRVFVTKKSCFREKPPRNTLLHFPANVLHVATEIATDRARRKQQQGLLSRTSNMLYAGAYTCASTFEIRLHDTLQLFQSCANSFPRSRKPMKKPHATSKGLGHFLDTAATQLFNYFSQLLCETTQSFGLLRTAKHKPRKKHHASCARFCHSSVYTGLLHVATTHKRLTTRTRKRAQNAQTQTRVFHT